MFCKISTQVGGLTPPHPLRTPLQQHNDIARVFEQVTTIISRKPNNDFVAFTQQLVFSNKHKICSGGSWYDRSHHYSTPKTISS